MDLEAGTLRVHGTPAKVADNLGDRAEDSAR
jgi:hypothetical protein